MRAGPRTFATHARDGVSCVLTSPCLHLCRQVLTTNAYMLGMVAVLAACTIKLGPLAMFNLYLIPYWINVVWLDIVTYLHHHGSHDQNEKMPWYRGEVGVRGCQGVSGFPSGAWADLGRGRSVYKQARRASVNRAADVCATKAAGMKVIWDG